MPVDAHEQRIGTMPHQADAAPQTVSAGEPGRGSATPTYAGAPAGWPAPAPSLLEDGCAVVLAFPLDTVSQPWRKWVSDTAGGAGAPVDCVAQAVLDAIGRPLVSVEKLLQRDSAAGASPLQAAPGTVGGGKACPEQGRRVVVQDPALATLTRSVTARPPGVLLWRDEPTPSLYAIAREASRGKPRGPVVDAWSAASVFPASIPCSQRWEINLAGH
jgi:hypothetical protein